jgi:hypothetical protein
MPIRKKNIMLTANTRNEIVIQWIGGGGVTCENRN